MFSISIWIFLTVANLTVGPLHSAGYQPTHLSFSEKWTWDANRAPDTALHSSSALPSHNERLPGIFKFIHQLKQQLRSNQNTEGAKPSILRVLSLIVFHAIIHLSLLLFTSYSSHSEGGKTQKSQVHHDHPCGHIHVWSETSATQYCPPTTSQPNAKNSKAKWNT